jgi:hypothetical protein
MVLGIFRDRIGSFPAWRPKARGTQGRMALLVPWGYIHSASRDRRDGAELMLPQQARQT